MDVNPTSASIYKGLQSSECINILKNLCKCIHIAIITSDPVKWYTEYRSYRTQEWT